MQNNLSVRRLQLIQELNRINRQIQQTQREIARIKRSMNAPTYSQAKAA